ncbi:hypothetical protein A2U01_0014312 [Trifolium medium]|uniref:Uncharacterized protein n=1 Tax=Trifolium medium TaxID=97028 RepID=A0A392N196_9FABA|nr:hypothetical protein [Trifolium medium]
MEDDFLIFPSDVSAEVEALKAKIGDALDKYEKIIQKTIEGRGMDVVRVIMESVERADTKRLTLTPHFEPEERVVLETFEKSLQEASEQMALDKGKKIMDSKPPAYVLKLQEDFDS